MIENKIIIGSANVNTKYGFKKNNIKTKEFKKLLKNAKLKKINFIDTSPKYSNSEKVIGSIKEKFNIITKIPKIPLNTKKNKIEDWIINKFITSLRNLNSKFIYGVLIQNAEILLSNKGDNIYNALVNFKNKKKIKKIGVSIYDFKKLEKIINKFKIDFVQVPFNIFDQRLVEKSLIPKLKKRGIEIHVRSVFLQGLLTEKNLRLPSSMKDLNKNLKIWEKWIKKNKINPINACLDFVLRNKDIDKIVIGFNSFKDFKQVISHKKSNIKFTNLKLSVNKNIVDPRNWKK